MTDKYAVIGNPVAHSKSPLIHKMFAEQTGQDISYEKIEAPLDGFAATIERLRKDGYKGCNVTVPFKFEAFNIATELSKRAQAAKAVNTLKFDNEKIIGDNTDGAGLVHDIECNIEMPLKGKRVLLMGAGGAAYGVLVPLSQRGAGLAIVNRTIANAWEMIKPCDASQLISIYDYSQLVPLPNSIRFNIIINATSTGLTDEMPPLPSGIFAPGALAYDMMYGRETPFMKFARAQGAQVADGLGMLVEQAAEAFYIWRGVRPDTAPVIAALRA
ncbi:MAG: shikimate dehydrogenase [Gallionella sp.]|nr:shikimate dehydrogenase [Gallionella sp.]